MVVVGADAFELHDSEGEIVAAEAAAFSARLNDPAARARYAALASAAASGNVPDELIASLETLLELAVERGGPPALQAIFQRTPRGSARAIAARDVNRALQSLQGQRIEKLQVSGGRATLVLETDRCRVTLVFEASGPRLESVETTT